MRPGSPLLPPLPFLPSFHRDLESIQLPEGVFFTKPLLFIRLRDRVFISFFHSSALSVELEASSFLSPGTAK